MICKRRRRVVAAVTGAMTLVAMPSLVAAQTAAPAPAPASAENALRSADDAFGTSVGRESIGLYSAGNVRGFSPITAGNVRVEGLYFDAVVTPNGRLAAGSTIRVGISAQGYPFPAPTGIADYRLRLPGEAALATATLAGFSSGGISGDFDVRLPLIPGKLGLAGGLSYNYDFQKIIEPVGHGGASLLLRWTPADNAEIIPFWSHFIHRDDPAQPRFVVTGDFLPPKISREEKLIQPWALNDVDDNNIGVIARASFGPWRFNTGLFRSLRNADVNFSDQFLDVAEDGTAARHRIVATPPQRTVGISGEMRLSREFLEGTRAHQLHFALRGRDQKRRYGGSASAEFGPAFIGDPPVVEQPDFLFGAQSRDEVRQWSGGIAYEGRWAGVGEVALGIQRASYRKSVVLPTRVQPDTRDAPWLFNAAVAIHATPQIAFYASMARGLEESAVAPDLAVNRDEAPPALLTSQIDGGIRWAISPKLKLIAGVFDVRKPYFNLDPLNVYRRLGDVRHRGIELSFAGTLLPNLQVVAGAVLLDAKASGDAVDLGIIGSRPVGSTGRTVILNAEYSPPQITGLSLDASINSSGRRAANARNSLFLPPTATLDAGLRYRWNLAGKPVSLRLQGTNLLNDYAWELRASNAFYFSARRQFNARLSVDL